LKVPYLDLKSQYDSIRDEIRPVVDDVFESQAFILGSKVEDCESAIADYCGCAHAVGVSSGTDALLIALMAEGIGPGDEVITTSYTFFATAGAIARTGATPVFVDIDPATYNIDATRIEERLTDRTRAIMPVHLYGQMADMDPIMALADRHDLVVIEDGAQAIGAEHAGRRAGSIGDYGCFSFYPSKNLGAAGDGGMVVTNDAERGERLRLLRTHGSVTPYRHQVIGGNFRLAAIQAAVVAVKLRHLDAWTTGRQVNAGRYDRLFTEAGLVESGPVGLPVVTTDRHIFNLYVVRVPERDALMAFLQDNGIGCGVYYPVPLHLQACFTGLGYREGELPESERAAKETLALPIYPELTDEQAGYVVERVKTFMSEKREHA
jgi:dTDP-4-amino-4,6-dideoxygalactose transaminase